MEYKSPFYFRGDFRCTAKSLQCFLTKLRIQHYKRRVISKIELSLHTRRTWRFQQGVDRRLVEVSDIRTRGNCNNKLLTPGLPYLSDGASRMPMMPANDYLLERLMVGFSLREVLLALDPYRPHKPLLWRLLAVNLSIDSDRH